MATGSRWWREREREGSLSCCCESRSKETWRALITSLTHTHTNTLTLTHKHKVPRALDGDKTPLQICLQSASNQMKALHVNLPLSLSLSFPPTHTHTHTHTHTLAHSYSRLWDLIGSFQFTTELTATCNYRHRQSSAHYWGVLDFQTATPEGRLSSLTSTAEWCLFCWQAPLSSTCYTEKLSEGWWFSYKPGAADNYLLYVAVQPQWDK